MIHQENDDNCNNPLVNIGYYNLHVGANRPATSHVFTPEGAFRDFQLSFLFHSPCD